MSAIDLDSLLDPASLVLVGASDREGSPGRSLAANLISSDFAGRVQLVNPRYAKVFGEPCVKSLKHTDGDIDIALLLLPKHLLRRTLEACALRDIGVAIIYSEADDPAELQDYARQLGIRLIGPWSAGLMRPAVSLNATFATHDVIAGQLAVISQSATLAAALVDWAESSRVGFSSLFSTGAESDVNLSDLLDLVADDSQTRAIIVYLDRVRGSRRFLSALAAAARRKPIVLMKSTRDDARYCDALARSGREFGTNDAFQAALSRSGVVQINTYSKLFSAAEILSTRVGLHGRRLAIVTNGAAPAMLASERLQRRGFQLPALHHDSKAALSKALMHIGEPTGVRGWLARDVDRWDGLNPIELHNTEHLAEQMQTTLEVLGSLSEYDAILVIYVPDTRNDANVIANAVISAKTSEVPIVGCWMGEAQVQRAHPHMSEAGIPLFPTPEAATDAIEFLYRYYRSQQQLLQLPAPTAADTRIDTDSARSLLRSALDKGDRVLGPQRTHELMTYFDIDVLPAVRAITAEDAVSAARDIGYPVVVKLVSPNVAWKAPIIRTALDLKDDEGVRQAFDAAREALLLSRPDAEFRGVFVEAQYTAPGSREISIRLERDPTFGPIVSMGIGGDLSSLMLKRAVQLPPLNSFLIDEMLNEPQLSDYLGAFRHNEAIDTAPLAAVLRRISEIACELPDVFSLDINPLIVSSHGAVAVDAHAVLERFKPQPGTSRRYGHLTIHPWPRQWTRKVTVKDGRTVTLRAIRPEDGDSLQDMVKNMSEESRYMRFMHTVKALSPAMLAQFTKLDYDRQIAFIADPGDGSVSGESRYTINRDGQAAEFAVSIADDWHGQGLATVLMELLIEYARVADLHFLHGDVLVENTGMRHLMKKLGFSANASEIDRDVLVYTLPLEPFTDE